MDQTIHISLFIPPVHVDTASAVPALLKETCLIIKISLQEVEPGVYVYFCHGFGDGIFSPIKRHIFHVFS